MKIAMLLPLLPLHAAAEELRKLTTTIDKTATTKTVSGTLSEGTTPECGLKNMQGTECLGEWNMFGKMIFNHHCVSTEPAWHIDCRSCQWCSGVTDTATIKPVADTELTTTIDKTATTKTVSGTLGDGTTTDFIDCTHKNCLQWTCKNWCHCYEEMFDEIYAFGKCVGEDTCNCGEMDNGPIDEPSIKINTDWREIFYLYGCRNEGLPSKLYTEADVKYMKVMVDSLHYEVDCEAELKARGDTALTKTDDTTVSRETADDGAPSATKVVQHTMLSDDTKVH